MQVLIKKTWSDTVQPQEDSSLKTQLHLHNLYHLLLK